MIDIKESNFPCKVTAHFHLGTAYLIEFTAEVIARENALLEANR